MDNATKLTTTRRIEPGVDACLSLAQLFIKAAEFARGFEQWPDDYEGRRDFPEAVASALDDLPCFVPDDIDEICQLLNYAEAGLRRRQAEEINVVMGGQALIFH